MNKKWMFSMVIMGLVGMVVGFLIFDLMPISSAEKAGAGAEREVLAKELKGASSSNLSASFKKVIKLVKPAVVTIRTEKKVEPRQRAPRAPQGRRYPFRRGPFQFFFDFDFDRDQLPDLFHDFPLPRQGLGSGIIVHEDGYILTNNHVIDGFKEGEIQVILADESVYSPEIIGADKNTDLAVLKIKGTQFPYVELGDSDKVEEGDWVLAIGAPFQLSNSVSQGIISAIGRTKSKLRLPSRSKFAYGEYLQTDAAINPGNSGGPLVNMQGEVIGINTAIETTSGGYQGIGFAITSNIAKEVMEQLIEGGKVVRGYLGVTIQDIDAVTAEELGYGSVKDLMDAIGIKSTEGVYVREVHPGSPAGDAGIRNGDVIVEVDGKKVTNSDELADAVRHTRVGKKVAVKAIRDGKEQSLDVVIAEQPQDIEAVLAGKGPRGRQGERAESGQLGVTVQELTDPLAKQLGYEGEEGVVVVDVAKGSRAERAGLEAGDLIMKVNGQPVTSVQELETAVKETKRGETILLIVRDKRGSHLVTVE